MLKPISTSTTTVDQLSQAITAAIPDLDEQDRRIVVALYELLAHGDPVPSAELASHSRAPESVVLATLQGWPGVFRDDEGRVVGFWGLAIPDMDHHFQADGGKPIHAWCALDPFMIVPVISRAARIESKDPVTAEPITMTVTPTGVEHLSPESAVVSFIVPDKPWDHDVIESFCHYVHNFTSRESAERWASEKHGIVLVPVSDAFEIGRRSGQLALGERRR